MSDLGILMLSGLIKLDRLCHPAATTFSFRKNLLMVLVLAGATSQNIVLEFFLGIDVIRLNPPESRTRSVSIATHADCHN